jgi:S-DNA-T family DNA segregation ATPase FtsK/SpoIIIE
MAIKKKSEDRASTPIEPYQEKSKPLSALFFFLIGFLVLVALWDYKWGQSKVTTTNPTSENVVGAFGAESSYLLYHWLGFTAWVVPLILYWISYLLGSAKSRRLLRFKSIGYPLVFITISGLLAILSGALYQEAPETMPKIYTSGLGGVLGSLVYTDLLETWLGAFGSVALFLTILIASLLSILTNDMGVAYDRFREKLGILLGDMGSSLNESKESFFGNLRERSKIRKEIKEEARRRRLEEKEAAKLAKEEEKLAKKEMGKKVVKEDEADSLLPDPFSTSTSAKKELAPVIEKEIVPVEDIPAPKPTAAEIEAARLRSEKEANQSLGKIKIVEAEVVDRVEPVIPLSRGDYEFPSIDLLGEAPEYKAVPQEEIEDTANRLQQTLSEFKIKVELGEVHTGPVITRYDIFPAAGVKVEKIAGLDKNLAMSMRAEAVRVLAPVPGKGCVGVEVPNRKPLPVCMREIIESKAWAEAKEGLPLILGKDVSGKPLVADLTKMPHLLIAGSTGSGKSVCLNSIIASMCYYGSPEDVRFIMVDPKIVEMQAYNSLPHMLIPVVTNPKKVPGALKWLISEMDRRYHAFKNAGVRNIAGFNDKILRNKEDSDKAEALDAVLSPEERIALNSELDGSDDFDSDYELPTQKLPYIVCIIDELADLMMVAPADIETCIARIAQLARAAGIHLILATQRPSVNVITGVIKANLPSRIAFKVASYRDSMTILDCKGAETLIGKGDMLFIPPGASTLIRAQGAFLSDDEINGIVEFLKRNGPPQFVEEVQRQVEASGDEEGGEDEESFDESDLDDDEILLRKVLQLMKASRRASTSMFQRRLKIGYNRAGRIMDMLEDRGYVGPDNGSQPREILVDLDSL